MKTWSRALVAIGVVCSVAAAADFDPSVARRIKPEEVQQRQKAGEKVIILDTRESPGDTIVKGAEVVPGERIEEWAKKVPKKSLIVTYCT
jgi:hypothetical protein